MIETDTSERQGLRTIGIYQEEHGALRVGLLEASPLLASLPIMLLRVLHLPCQMQGGLVLATLIMQES